MKSLTLNNLGEKYLVEQCQKVSIKMFTDKTKSKIKDLLLSASLEYQNKEIKIGISRTYKNGIRYWFICPLCNKRAGVIYSHPITSIVGCRTCLNLAYKKSKYKGMVENI